ncbi:M10 family metallopeptidase C-terminal domain-containing protein [Nostoc sp. FACHB-973]|nr:M10 family metallopeptidase C-terminal domain-containing protein [Nostoc sp. FACHB-973]
MTNFLDFVLPLTYNQLSAFSDLENFWNLFDSVFGTQYNRTISATVRSQWQAGDFSQLPQIEIIGSDILGNANGAYASSTNKIYLSDSFVATATPAAVSTVLLEEIGHFVDAHINRTDAAGDEGAIFAALVQGYSLDAEALQALKTEDDHATITVNGQQIEVEQANYTGDDNANNLVGGTDNDLLIGLGGNDSLLGGAGSDGLYGDDGNDSLLGGTGNDNQSTYLGESRYGGLYGGAGNDTINGGDGDDYLDPGTGIDSVIGGAGIDTLNIDYTGETTALTINYLNDTSALVGDRVKIQGVESIDIVGSTSSDSIKISATTGKDKVFGGTGNDLIETGLGNDLLVGEYDNDSLLGGAGSDGLYGDDGNDSLLGGTGNDNQSTYLGESSYGGLYGGAGNDTLIGVNPTSSNPGRGEQDYLAGGTQADRFVLGDSTWIGYDDGNSATNGNSDYAQIADFNASEGDVIQLQGTSSNYLLAISGADTQILLDKPGTEPDELIAIIKNQTGLSRTATYFVYKPLLANITLALSSNSVTEDGTTNLVYTFTRTGNITNALTVNYSVGGTATFNTDYTQSGAASFTATTGTITFAAGATTATLTINPTADTTFESNETVVLTLASGTGYTIGTTTSVTGTITNDDSSSSISINLSNNQTIVEGYTSPQNATYTVSLSNASTQTITVQYATANGTATAGVDYTSTTGTLTFNPGDTSKVINIPILNDSINEADKTFSLTLTSPTNANLGTTANVTTTITDTLSASVTTTLPTNVENLTLTGTAAINGTGNAGNNILKGNSANNILSGGAGNDIYSFLANTSLGTDTITEITTGGTDTIDFSSTTVAVIINLSVTTSQTVNSNLKLILSANNAIENATGGTGNDRLTGNTLNNTLIGGDGNDQLQGLGGNDTLQGGNGNDILTGGTGDDFLWGGLGDDILTGGSGKDQYVFQGNGVFSTSLGVDYISEFEAGQDQIVLSKTSFNSVTNIVGQALTDFAIVSDDEFVNASNARIVFSQSSGSLFYNQDGNLLGTATVFEFARLGNPDITLSTSDFTLIA